MKFDIEDVWNLVLGIEKELIPILEPNSTSPTNQNDIFTWKKKNQMVFSAFGIIWIPQFSNI